MKTLLSSVLVLFVLMLCGCEKNESVIPVSNLSSKVEEVPEAVGKEIKENLKEFSRMTEYPKGFGSIEDVKLDWISIAGIHTRKATLDDLFLFPYWNQSIERKGWETGIAFRKNSPIVYTWKIRTNQPE